MEDTKALFAESCNGQLKGHHVDQWRKEGYVFVADLLPESLVSAVKDAASQRYPEPGSDEAENITDFGSLGTLNFPSPVSSLNDLTLHPNLLGAVAGLLGTAVDEVRLTQSDLWSKYGRKEIKGAQDNQDQRIHIDYPNHTLAHPSPWDRPEAVEMIIYFDDCETTGGGTAVVPRQGQHDPAYRWPIIDSPGIGDLRYINDRTSAEAYFAEERPDLTKWRQTLYERERHAHFKPGDILFYRHDTWHRGTPMTPGSRRIVHNITYRRAEAEWVSTLHVGWAWKAYRDSKYLERLIANASLDQRAVLGFPQPGNPYWCEETIDAVEARYGMFGMDMTPYRRALTASDG